MKSYEVTLRFTRSFETTVEVEAASEASAGRTAKDSVEDLAVDSWDNVYDAPITVEDVVDLNE